MVEKTGWTPGPWHRLEGFAEPGHPAYKPGQRVIRIVRARAPGQTEFVTVALVDSDNAWDDAKLIAAAPALAEALQVCREILQTLAFYFPQGSLGKADAELGIERADSALSLALGSFRPSGSTPGSAASDPDQASCDLEGM